jgi:hypothetical protein
MAKEESQEWDNIHFGLEETSPVDPTIPADDDITEDNTFASDDGLEGSKLISKDDDDPIPPPTPVADPDKPADVPVSTNMSGLELYLAQFDIEAGMIQFEDGTAKHFNDLDAAKQAEVLQQLHNTQATTVESKYGLDESEIGLLNYLRSNNISVEEMVDSMVAEKVASLSTLQGLAGEDYTKMDADALYIKFLQDTSPEATPEQITSDLAKAKELSNFNKLTESLRGQFISQQAAAIAAQDTASQAERTQLVESQRQEIVNAVLPMTEIAGITLDQNIKNTVLDHILETNDEGDSAFMDEVFSDPKSLFKAAFWYVYGESLVAQRDEYWKKEKSAAYKRGKEDALGVTNAPATGKTFIAKSTPPTNPTTPRSRQTSQETDGEDWSELHQI